MFYIINLFYICTIKMKQLTLKLNIMTTQDLSKNRERIINKIKSQITLATKEQIIDVMNKMVAMLPQFSEDKPLAKNIDKLTIKATLSYIKYGMVSTNAQNEAFVIRREEKIKSELQSSLQY